MKLDTSLSNGKTPRGSGAVKEISSAIFRYLSSRMLGMRVSDLITIWVEDLRINVVLIWLVTIVTIATHLFSRLQRLLDCQA